MKKYVDFEDDESILPIDEPRRRRYSNSYIAVYLRKRRNQIKNKTK